MQKQKPITKEEMKIEEFEESFTRKPKLKEAESLMERINEGDKI